LIKSAGANRCTLRTLGLGSGNLSQPVYEGEAGKSMSPYPIGESASLDPLFVFMLFALIQGIGGSAKMVKLS